MIIIIQLLSCNNVYNYICIINNKCILNNKHYTNKIIISER